MKCSALLLGLASCLSPVSAKSITTATSKINLAATFKPRQVFQNVNLVHIIQLEKNYAKETVNTKITNIADKPQDEYFLPFKLEQLSRLGGLEARDKKNTESGPFQVEMVEYDPDSSVQYYRIKFPEPLEAGGEKTISISYYLISAYRPLPASIGQDEKQFLVYQSSAYVYSAYTTSKQKTEIKLPSSAVADYTELPGSGDVSENPQKSGSKLTYGPYENIPAGAELPIQVRFEFNKPVTHVSRLERDIEVSHWGGNVAFEERYTVLHRGANLSSLFNRVKWQQQQHYSPDSYALTEFIFPLPASSTDPYYYDVIGNVTTSNFRSSKREALLVTKPRYPLFGGWKYPFTIGWNADAKHFLRRSQGGGYVLKVPFLQGPKQPEGLEYEDVVVRVILPEGAESIRYYTDIPPTSITSIEVDIHKTFLDTVGRTTLVIKARNLVDEFRDRQLMVSYNVPFLVSVRKPLVIFGSMLATFVVAYVIGGVELKFSGKSA